MARKIRMNVALETRRKELDEELRAIQRELRRRTRDTNNRPDPVAVLRRIWTGFESAPESPPAPGGAADRSVTQPAAPASTDGSVGLDSAVPVGEREADVPGPIRRGDARFASYFVTGGLHGIAPLRHEKRVFRNRVIAWVVLGLFILITIYMIFF
jgi:hypothetical protein